MIPDCYLVASAAENECGLGRIKKTTIWPISPKLDSRLLLEY